MGVFKVLIELLTQQYSSVFLILVIVVLIHRILRWDKVTLK